MSTELILNEQAVSFHSYEANLTKSGSFLTFAKWANANGAIESDLASRTERKTWMKAYDTAKKEFYGFSRQAVALAIADKRLEVTKLRPKYNKDGDFLSLTTEFKIPKATSAPKVSAETEKLHQIIAELKAQLQSVEA